MTEYRYITMQIKYIPKPIYIFLYNIVMSLSLFIKSIIFKNNRRLNLSVIPTHLKLTYNSLGSILITVCRFVYFVFDFIITKIFISTVDSVDSRVSYNIVDVLRNLLYFIRVIIVHPLSIVWTLIKLIFNIMAWTLNPAKYNIIRVISLRIVVIFAYIWGVWNVSGEFLRSITRLIYFTFDYILTFIFIPK